jgi:hypothetical protein
VPTATNGDIRVGGAAAGSDPDDGGQSSAATTGDVHVGNGLWSAVRSPHHRLGTARVS